MEIISLMSGIAVGIALSYLYRRLCSYIDNKSLGGWN